MTTSLFNAPESNTPVEGSNEISNYLDELVGEGKKFKDVEALARSVIFKDQHITNVERDNAELRKEVNTRISLEEFMTKNQSLSNDPVNQQIAEQHKPSEKGLSQEELQTLVSVEYAKQEQARIRQANLDGARDQLIEKWGTNYGQRLGEQAKALGVGVDFLNDLAAKSPKAFASLVGLDKQQNQVQANAGLAPRTNTLGDAALTSHSHSNGTRNQTYYDKMKRENPKNYFSTEVTIQRHKDAQSLGEDFFK